VVVVGGQAQAWRASREAGLADQAPGFAEVDADNRAGQPWRERDGT
jgi:hypothetical protein